MLPAGKHVAAVYADSVFGKAPTSAILMDCSTIDVATDPMIVLARSLETDAVAIAERFDKEVTAMQAAAYPKIGQAVFVVDGAKAYPDATGTLRLSYGAVKGYKEDGKTIKDPVGHTNVYVTSAGSAPSLGKHVLMAYLPPQHALLEPRNALAERLLAEAKRE